MTTDRDALVAALDEAGATPFRYMLDGSPCWCISADDPHDGWVHAPACDRMLREYLPVIRGAALGDALAAARREPVEEADAALRDALVEALQEAGEAEAAAYLGPRPVVGTWGHRIVESLERHGIAVSLRSRP